MFEHVGVVRSLVHFPRWLVAVLILAGCAVGRGVAAVPDSSWVCRAYQTEEGLPDLSITDVAQTADGYLWVATKGGLACFNGEKFVALPRANLPLLPSRAVRAMLRDRRDQLWLGMERGPLLCFKPDGLESFTAKDGLPGQRVVTMAEDAQGAVWVVYPSQVRRILNGQVRSIALPRAWPEQGDLLATADGRGRVWCARGTRLGVWGEGEWQSEMSLEAPVTAIRWGGESSLWIAAAGRLLKLEEGHLPAETGRLPDRAVAQVLFEDRSGALWIGTVSDGLFRWAGGQLDRVPTSHQEITCLNEDREGNIWAGTSGGGLNLIRPRTAALIGKNAGLPFESVLSVCEDTGGWLWAAAQDGRLARERNGRWEVLNPGSDWPGGSATCVAADRQGGVWVGTSDRGLKYFRNGTWREWFKRHGLASDNVRSLMVASTGDLWFASIYPARLQRLRDGQALVLPNTTPLVAIRALAERADGTIWIGTSDGKILRVAGATLVAEPAIAEPTPLSVRSLLASKDGSLWIGYAGDGLGRLKAGRYQRLTTAAGLADDFISQLLEDDRGNLWITGNRGLWRVSLSELDAVMAGRVRRVSAQAYGSAEGLPGAQPNRDYCPSAWRARDGRLWFAMRSGLLVVDPHRLRDNPYPPPVLLERVSVDDAPVAVYNAGSPLQVHSGSNVVNLRGISAPLRVGPGHRKLEIDFSALSFSSPENVQFRHRLSGFDQDWVEAGPRRRATYPRLPAGSYEFRVLACNSAGAWNETGAAVSFRVAPFFWETWWFKVSGGGATALLAAGTAFAVSRRRYREKLRRLEARRALEQERARIARDIHDDLGASLTRISLLSQPGGAMTRDAQGAAATLAQIHRTARDLTHAMGEVVWAVNPEHDSFDSLANYLSQYAQNFLKTAAIRCRLEMPLQLPQQPVSAELRHNLFLAFKEALNNVAKHAQASEVRIALIPGDSGFELLVADNGRGFGPRTDDDPTTARHGSSPPPGNGLANMRSRLREIGGDCELRSEPGRGTRITFRVKFRAYHGHS